jgi:hypothetical protein
MPARTASRGEGIAPLFQIDFGRTARQRSLNREPDMRDQAPPTDFAPGRLDLLRMDFAPRSSELSL